MLRKLIMLCCIFGSFGVDAQVSLFLNLQKGQSYSIAASQKTTVTESTFGPSSKTTNTLTGTYVQKVIEETDSVYLLQTKLISVTNEIESPSEKSYHSSNLSDTPDVKSVLLHRMMNKPFEVTKTKDFKWKSVKGLTEVLVGSYEGFEISAENKKKLDSLIRKEVSNLISTEELFSYKGLSSKTIVPGDKWIEYSVSEKIISTNDTINYYIAEIYGDDIVVKGKGTTSSLNKEILYEGIGSTFFLNGTIDYTATFDKTSKWIKHAVVEIEMSGYAMSRKDGSVFKTRIPMTISSKVGIVGSILQDLND